MYLTERLQNYHRIAILEDAPVKGASSGFQGIESPVKLAGDGLAAFSVSRDMLFDEEERLSLYTIFDPREGNLTLNFPENGKKPVNESSVCLLRVDVGNKLYPATIFLARKVYRDTSQLEDYDKPSHLSVSGDIVSQYVLGNHDKDFIIHDRTATPHFTFLSIPNCTSYMWGNLKTATNDSVVQAIEVRNECHRASHAGNKQEYYTHLSLIGRKEFIQLRFNSTASIQGNLSLSAPFVEIFNVQGKVDDHHHIDFDEGAFNLTLLGDLTVNSRGTRFELIQDLPQKSLLLTYAKPNSNISVYQLTLQEDLQTVLNTLSVEASEVSFSTTGQSAYWSSPASEKASLVIQGQLRENYAVIVIQKDSITRNEFNPAGQLSNVVVEHKGSEAFLLEDMVLLAAKREVKNQVKQEQDSLLPHWIFNWIQNKQNALSKFLFGDQDQVITFNFLSPEGYPVTHYFPNYQSITLNSILYLLDGKGGIYAIPKENSLLDGRLLLRYSKPGRRRVVTVPLYIENSFASNNVTWGKEVNTFYINSLNLTLRHVPDATNLYFVKKRIFSDNEQQVFSVKALRDTFSLEFDKTPLMLAERQNQTALVDIIDARSNRSRRALLRDEFPEPVSSGAGRMASEIPLLTLWKHFLGRGRSFFSSYLKSDLPIYEVAQLPVKNLNKANVRTTAVMNN